MQTARSGTGPDIHHGYAVLAEQAAAGAAAIQRSRLEAYSLRAALVRKGLFCIVARIGRLYFFLRLRRRSSFSLLVVLFVVLLFVLLFIVLFLAAPALLVLVPFRPLSGVGSGVGTGVTTGCGVAYPVMATNVVSSPYCSSSRYPISTITKVSASVFFAQPKEHKKPAAITAGKALLAAL